MPKITQEYLDAQVDKDVPKDWDTNEQYNPRAFLIYSAWLEFTKVFVGMETNEGCTLHLVGPSLPWNLDPSEPFVTLEMNFMTTNITNSIKVGEHPATARRSDGSLKSLCWQLLEESVGPVAYKKILKKNFSPFAYPYDGKQTDIFAEKYLKVIMARFKTFLKEVYLQSDRVLLCSQAVKAQVIALFGGTNAWMKFLETSDVSFFSASTDENDILTTCHPEFLLNVRFRNVWTQYYAILWDILYNLVLQFLGSEYVCTVGADIIAENGGSAAYEILKLAREEQNQRNSVRQSNLYLAGEHPFQKAAREKLEKEGFVGAGEDPNKVYQEYLIAAGTHNFHNFALQQLKIRNVAVLPGTNVLSLYQQVLMKKGDHNFHAHALQQLKKRGRVVKPL